eukprot:5640578-Pleurochrysis_carterae.AAC.4
MAMDKRVRQRGVVHGCRAEQTVRSHAQSNGECNWERAPATEAEGARTRFAVSTCHARCSLLPWRVVRCRSVIGPNASNSARGHGDGSGQAKACASARRVAHHVGVGRVALVRAGAGRGMQTPGPDLSPVQRRTSRKSSSDISAHANECILETAVNKEIGNATSAERLLAARLRPRHLLPPCSWQA